MARALRWGAAGGVLGFTIFAILFFLLFGPRVGRPDRLMVMTAFSLIGGTFAAVLAGIFGATRSAMQEVEELSYEIERYRNHEIARRESHR